MPSEQPARRPRGHAASSPLWCGLIVVLFLAIAVVPFGSELRRPMPTGGIIVDPPTSEAFDQDAYHLPIIRRFSEELPRPDLRGYRSATTPGYHLMQAIVWRATASKAAMLGVNLAIGAALVALIWSIAARHTGGPAALWLTLPAAWSVYVLGASVWLTTDSLGWLAALGAVGLSAIAPRSHRRTLAAGVASGVAVAVRQVHVWSLAPAALSGLMRSPLARWLPGFLFDEGEREAPRSPVGVAAGGFAAALPALVLAAFVLAWGGLLPMNDEMRVRHGGGFAPAGLPFFAACLGVFGWPALLLIPRAARRAARSPITWTIVLGAALAAALPHTSFDPDAHRKFGWLWHGVRTVQQFGGEVFAARSPVIIALAGLGAFVLVAGWRAARARGLGGSASILLLSALGFALAQSMNNAVWQRYYEPMAIVTVAWLVSLGVPRDLSNGLPPWRWTGFVALALAQLGVAIFTVVRPALG